MASTTYMELLEGVANYYGSGSDEWLKIARGGVTAETIPILRQVPGVTITESINGKFLGYDYKNPFPSTQNPASVIDSNIQTGIYGIDSFSADLPSTAVTDPQTGLQVMESGAKTVSTGAKVVSVANKIATGLMAVSLGSKLGKKIDETLYNANPDFWDDVLPGLNPDTWESIATTDAGKTVVRALFGIESDTQSATMYLDERLLAYTYMALLQNGAYSDGGSSIDGKEISINQTIAGTDFLIFDDFSSACAAVGFDFGTMSDYNRGEITSFENAGCKFAIISTNDSTAISDYRGIIVLSPTSTLNSYDGIVVREDGQSGCFEVNPIINTGVYRARFYYTHNNGTLVWGGTTLDPIRYVRNYAADTLPSRVSLCAGTIISSGGLEGVTDNENAGIHVTPSNVINPRTQRPVTPADDPDDVLQALKDAYPELFEDEIYEDIPQEDGTPERHIYIPVPYPDFTDEAEPVTDDTPGRDPQTEPEITPENTPEPKLDNFVKTIVDDPEPPVTGEGDTPPVVIPPGTANALYSIYNPSQSELDSFGSWLWSTNFVDQLLKLFNDPMQAIIGLHKVFAAPYISGVGTIKVGYLDSGVPSNLVGNQYTTVDCGSVSLREYFGNVFDYSPFTEVYVYLPFIGIQKLDTGDVMRATLKIVYHVDVITGACLAEIRVTRDGAGGTIYTYTGNAAVQYPISSGSYMGIVASLASIAGGIVGTIGSGGALAPLAMGSVGGILNAHTRVQHSGGFSGNAGAMGSKKPYLIITRPQTALAKNFYSFEGYPANKYTTIKDCSGYFRVKDVHLEGILATDGELSELESLLKSGVLK